MSFTSIVILLSSGAAGNNICGNRGVYPCIKQTSVPPARADLGSFPCVVNSINCFYPIHPTGFEKPEGKSELAQKQTDHKYRQ